MNTNPVTQKQLDFINTLKQQNDSKTSFLSGIVSTYERINQRQGHLPEKVSQACYLVIVPGTNDHALIPAGGTLIPADIIEMKKSFDDYIANYVPTTTTDASIIIDILKGNLTGWAAQEFIYIWLSKNYSITTEKSGQYIHYNVGK